MTLKVTTDEDLLRMYFLQMYGFLTITQAARVSGNSYNWTRERLIRMQREKLVKWFGEVSYGRGNRAPKVYYLTELGYQKLLEDGGYTVDDVGPFKMRNSPDWTTQTWHRIYLISCFLSLEIEIGKHPHLFLENVRLSYRLDGEQTNKYGNPIYETTDWITVEGGESLTPDGSFIIYDEIRDERELFFLEFDRKKETIYSRKSSKNHTLDYKFRKYESYLAMEEGGHLIPGNFTKKYSEFGNFDSFKVLFVTLSEQRLGNVISQASTLPADLHDYFLFSTAKLRFPTPIGSKIVTAKHNAPDLEIDMLGLVWRTRSGDNRRVQMLEF
jgi:hypothetical protein